MMRWSNISSLSCPIPNFASGLTEKRQIFCLSGSTTYKPETPQSERPIGHTRARMAKLHLQTGPVTATGKEISSRNATTHGGTSEKLIVAGERREDFDALFNDLVEEYSPETPDAHNLVEDAALARWFLWRRQRAFNSVESALYTAQSAPENWPAEAFHKLALLDRYKTAAERSLKRVLQNLAALQRAKKQEAQSKLAIARATVALDQLEREQWKTACNKFDRPTAVQEIHVRIRNGETVTRMLPSNAQILHETGRAVHPPEQVCRLFDFPDGVPTEYPSFTGRDTSHIIKQIVPVSVWCATAAQEEKLGTDHAVPGPDDPDHFVL
jgi:hypothetical protein